MKRYTLRYAADESFGEYIVCEPDDLPIVGHAETVDVVVVADVEALVRSAFAAGDLWASWELTSGRQDRPPNEDEWVSARLGR